MYHHISFQVNPIAVHAHKKWGVGAGRGNSPLVSDYTRYLYRSSHRAFPGQVSCPLSVLTNTSQPGFFSCSRDTYDTGFHKLLLPFPLRAPLLSGKEQPRDEKSPAKRVIDAVAVVQIAPRREPAQRRREPCVHCCSMSTHRFSDNNERSCDQTMGGALCIPARAFILGEECSLVNAFASL